MLTAILLATLGQTAPPTTPPAPAPYPVVLPITETTPVASSDDAADDPAFWINPQDPPRSLILGTNKKAGLDVYTLSGDLVARRADGRLNTVDVRQGVRLTLTKPPYDIAAATNRTNNTVVLYRVDPTTTELLPFGVPVQTALSEIYGLCLYHRRERADRPEALFIFINDKSGAVEQREVVLDHQGEFLQVALPHAKLVRTFHVGAQVEGMVADDDRAVVYIGEEDLGVWRYPAEPDSPVARDLVARTHPWGPLVADVEGLALYDAGQGAGYLVVSSQGDNSFHLFRRDDPRMHLGAFRVGSTDAIDAVEETDGIAVTSAPLPGELHRGAFVAHDGNNAGSNQNFKLVPWVSIERALKLTPAPSPLSTEPDKR